MRNGSFKTEWEVDFPRGEIRRKPRPFTQRWRDILNKPHFLLSEFHRYARSEEASENGVTFPRILDSNGMKAVDGVPKKLVLLPAYDIPDEDLKSMYGDGYVLIKEQKLIVASGSKWKWLQALELKPGLWGFSIDLKKLFGRN